GVAHVAGAPGTNRIPRPGRGGRAHDRRGRRVRVTVLGSGSGGNATLVESGGVAILVDAGFSGRDLERRLEAVGVDPAYLAGVVITHDHSDHTRGMGVLARRFKLPLYLTARTRDACADLLTGTELVHLYAAH